MAALALMSWPLIVLAIFAAAPPRGALVWSVFLAYLFLPERYGINLHGLPPLDKRSVAALAILAALLLLRPFRAEMAGPPPENHNRLFAWTFFGLAALLLLNMGLTIATNRNSQVIGTRVLSALHPWDFVSMTSATVFLVIPFFLGRRYLSGPEDHRLLMKSLAIAGLIYSPFILVEIRMSPQFHKWVYGFHQHSFAQHVRDGYRPMVFLEHGLSVGFLMFSSVLAATGMALAETGRRRAGWVLAAAWLLLMLLISRNLGAVMITAVLLPCLCLPRRPALLAITAITLIFLVYPAIRQAGLVPTGQVLELAGDVSDDRRKSLQFRLDNEDHLLARAAEKPVSGWGGWGRARVYNDQGRDISVTDGLWIIVLGDQGWLGYIGFFGLLTLPLLALPRVRRRKEIPPQTIAMAMIMAGNLIYLVPNSTLTPIAWLTAGALAGFVQFDPPKTASPTDPETAPRRRRRGYTRFPAQQA